MEHQEIEDKDLIDKYLLHQLTEEEENGFEEHLLFCNNCQKTLDDRKITIGLIRNNQQESHQKTLTIVKKTNKKKSSTYVILGIAAFVAVIFAITFLINILTEKSIIGKKISSNSFINDSIINNRTLAYNEDSQYQETYQLAEAYIEMPEFENFIKNNSNRAENLTLLSPKLTEKIKQNKPITINWTLQNTDFLNFVVFNNKGKLIFENKISSHFLYQQKLKPGLYYWQLETDEEALFTGKFIIEK